MDSKRNIFLEAAMTGRPVVVTPADIEEEAANKQRTAQKMKKLVPASQTSKKVKEHSADKETLIIKQAIGNVGRLPSKVLRYVEMMASHLSEVDKCYYSKVGKTGGPSRQAAMKRISRRIKNM